MSYYDIDDILAETEAVPCTFVHGAWGLGDLDDSADPNQRDLLPRTRVEVPLWVACLGRLRAYIAVEVPSFLQPKATLELLAGPTKASFEKTPYFYQVANKLAAYYYNIKKQEITRDVTTTMKKCLGVRLSQTIVTKDTVNGENKDISGFKRPLADLELKLFACKDDVAREVHDWRCGRLPSITPSQAVLQAKQQSLAKRKLTGT